MPIKIGFKINDIRNIDERIRHERVYEITTKDPGVGFNYKKIQDILDILKGKEASFHTQVYRLFEDHKKQCPGLSQIEISVLNSEINLCRMLNISEFIIHLKEGVLTKKEESVFEEIFNYAKERGVQIIYESNKFFSSQTCLGVLERFPYLNYNLDLGHLNTALKTGTLDVSLDTFLDAVKDRIVYVHAHNNNGREDTHMALNDGTLDWMRVLGKLDSALVRKVIIEAKGIENMIKTKESLNCFYSSRISDKKQKVYKG